MTSFDLMNLIGKAHDDYVLKARIRPDKKIRWQKPLAAVLALVLFASGARYLVLPLMGMGSSEAVVESAAAEAAAEAPAAPEAAPEEAPAEEAAPEAPAPEAAPEMEEQATDPTAYGSVELLAMASYPEKIGYEDYDGKSDRWTENQVSDATDYAVNAFSYKTAAAVLGGTQESSCFSPLSLYHTLAVLCSGAEGNTQLQLLNLLGMSDMETLSSEIARLYRLNNRDDEVNILKIANSLWLDDQLSDGTVMEYDPQWLITAATDYYAEVYAADFSSPETAEALGNWISRMTGGNLKPSGEEMGLSEDTVMSIVNTLWYKTQWADQFSEKFTTPDLFTLADGTQVECDFMHKTDSAHSAIVTEEYTKSYIRLDGGARMIFVLPQEGVDVMSLVSEEKLTEIFENGNYTDADVVWSVPKFETTVTYELEDTLMSLGITDAFDVMAADFSPMTESAPLFLSSVRQGTHIAVNEDGVEAAAWSMAGLEAGEAAPEEMPTVEMNLNRPFIYLITAQDGSNLFLGVVQNPIE